MAQRYGWPTALRSGVNALRITFMVLAVISFGLFALHAYAIATSDGAHWTMYMWRLVYGWAAAGAAGVAGVFWLWHWYLTRP